MKRKLLLLFIALSCATLIAACGGTEDVSQEESKDDGGTSGETTAPVEDYPTKSIDVIVSYSAGGGTDLGARLLLPYVEKELGVTMNVINKPGAGGWIGWNDLINSDPDGYTIAFVNTPNLITGFLDPNLNRDNDLNDFATIANHVTDYSTLSINSSDDRFSTIEEVIEYAKENELTAGTTGVGSHQHISVLTLNEKYGTNFSPVHAEGSADNQAALLGGHIDVMFDTIGNMYRMHQEGELQAVGILSKERSEFLPDVPTLEESGYPEVYGWSARGIAAPAGIDEKRLEVLINAFEKALNNKEQIEELAKMGLFVDPQLGEDHRKMLDEEENSIQEIKDVLGW